MITRSCFTCVLPVIHNHILIISFFKYKLVKENNKNKILKLMYFHYFRIETPSRSFKTFPLIEWCFVLRLVEIGPVVLRIRCNTVIWKYYTILRFLGPHYCILSLSNLCRGVEKKIFKEIMHFYFMTYMVMPQHKNSFPKGH